MQEFIPVLVLLSLLIVPFLLSIWPEKSKKQEEVVLIKEGEINKKKMENQKKYTTNFDIYTSKIVNFVKKNKWLVFAIAVAGVYFYWYQVRPGKIYSDCNRVAAEKTDGKFVMANDNSRAYYESAYKQCLRDKGLER
jgi:predicted RND superfamily exporter protein